MKLFELSKQYFNDYKEFIFENIKDSSIIDSLAFGIVGEGSECLKYDDDISRDHDLNFGFCIFIPDDFDEKLRFKLSRIYSKLPKEYKGYKKPLIGPAGTNRRGVFRIGDFYRKHIGVFYDEIVAKRKYLSLDYNFYLSLKPFYLLNASNGEVFLDNYGEFSFVRQVLKKGYPKDIILKKLSIYSISAHQEGAYNFERMMKRGDLGASAICCYEFVKAIVSIIYLLNNSYEPYYKWCIRGLDDLNVLKELKEELVLLLNLGYGINSFNELIEKDIHKNITLNDKNGIYEKKKELINFIIKKVCEKFNELGYSDFDEYKLDHHAYSIVNHIKDVTIRNMPF